MLSSRCRVKEDTNKKAPIIIGALMFNSASIAAEDSHAFCEPSLMSIMRFAFRLCDDQLPLVGQCNRKQSRVRA